MTYGSKDEMMVVLSQPLGAAESTADLGTLSDSQWAMLENNSLFAITNIPICMKSPETMNV
jgi:hypothetical protein